MSTRVQIGLCLGLILAQSLQAVSFLGSSFKVFSDMDNIIFDMFIIRSLSTWSPLDCSRKCEIHNTCLSFQYSHLSGQCRLFNTIYLHQDGGVYDIGWQYYITSKSMWHIIIIRYIMSNNPRDNVSLLLPSSRFKSSWCVMYKTRCTFANQSSFTFIFCKLKISKVCTL